MVIVQSQEYISKMMLMLMVMTTMMMISFWFGVQSVSSVYKKDWYKHMYNALHRPVYDQRQFSNTFLTYLRCRHPLFQFPL